MTVRQTALAALIMLLPASSAAEVGAVVVGSQGAEIDPANLAERIGAVLVDMGHSLADLQRTRAMTGDSIHGSGGEPSLGVIEEWARELDADVIVSVFVEAASDGDGSLALRAAVLWARSGRAVAASDTTSPAGITERAAGMVRGLIERSGAAPELTDPGQADGERPASEELTGQTGSTSSLDGAQIDARTEPMVPIDTTAEQPPPPLESPSRGRNDARVSLAVNATALGLLAMTSVLLAANVEDARLFAPILLAGGGGGLAAALVVNRWRPISLGDNSLVAVGGWYGAATGLLVAGTAGFDDLRWLMTGAIIGQVTGLTAGITAAAVTEMSSGDGAIIHSGAIWGLFCGGVMATLVSSEDPRASYGLLLSGLQAGLAAGSLVSRFVEVSQGRVAIVDLCGFLGVLLGASIGTPIIVESRSSGHLRAYAGVLLGAAAAGIGIGTVLTRNWDRRGRADDDTNREATSRRGLVLSYLPLPTVIPAAEGVAHAGPALGVRVLGGAW